MLKQPLSSFRGQVTPQKSHKPCAKLTVEIGFRAGNPAARDEEHKKANGDMFFIYLKSSLKFPHSLKY